MWLAPYLPKSCSKNSLDPTVGFGTPRGLEAIGRSSLGHDGGDMVAHGAAAKMQLRCDVRGPKTADEQTTDLNFTLAKRVIRSKEDVLGKLRIDDAQA